METNSPHLVVVGKPELPPCLLAPGITKIGRAADNDFRLRDYTVSRFHCIAVRTGDEVRLYDFSSHHATWIDHQKARGQLLKNGDTIQVGHLQLCYHGPTVAPNDGLATMVKGELQASKNDQPAQASQDGAKIPPARAACGVAVPDWLVVPSPKLSITVASVCLVVLLLMAGYWVSQKFSAPAVPKRAVVSQPEPPSPNATEQAQAIWKQKEVGLLRQIQELEKLLHDTSQELENIRTVSRKAVDIAEMETKLHRAALGEIKNRLQQVVQERDALQDEIQTLRQRLANQGQQD